MRRVGRIVLPSNGCRIVRGESTIRHEMEKNIRKFVGSPLAPAGDGFITPAAGNEPPVPRAFLWDNRTLVITTVLRSWRSTKTDRGDAYLKRHWFELQTASGEEIEVYYDRESRRGAARWWLYTISNDRSALSRSSQRRSAKE